MQTATEVETAWQPYADEVLMGDGAAVSRLRLQIQRIAPHFRTVLVTGERGVGKETVAREMHRQSGVQGSRFHAMDVGAFARGANAVDMQGVLLLKGLDRLEPGWQEALTSRLRAVQRETRIVMASELDLRAMLSTGRLRSSLASRVGSLEIRVAALRERMEDIESLLQSMLVRLDGSGRPGPEALDVLKLHGWPGNLEELWSVARSLADVPGVVRPGDLPKLAAATDNPHEAGTRLDLVMQRHVFEVLHRCGGNKLKAAELLGISRSTLYRMLEAASDAEAGLEGGGNQRRRNGDPIGRAEPASEMCRM